MRRGNLWICPYNPAHVMENNHRVQTHLAKCSKNYPDKKISVCLFNATHILPQHELEKHLLNCPDNKVMLRDMVQEKNDFVSKSSVEPVPEPMYDGLHATSEVWETGKGGRPGYDPQQEVKYRPIMRNPMPCAGKATQRDFRLKDIERLERLEKRLPPEDEPSETRKPVLNTPRKTHPLTQSKNQIMQKNKMRDATTDASSHLERLLPLQEQNDSCIKKAVVSDSEKSAQREAFSFSASMLGRGRSVMLMRPLETQELSIGHGKAQVALSENRPLCHVGRGVNRLISNERQFQSLDGYSLNDFGSHDPKKLQAQYLEKLREIADIKIKQRQGIYVSKDEQNMLDQESLIQERLEKLNIDC